MKHVNYLVATLARLSARLCSTVKLSLTCADGMLYGLSQQGKVLLIAHGPDEFEIVSSFELPKPGKMPAFAHPVVCGGRLYLRQGENLFAYDVRGSRE